MRIYWYWPHPHPDASPLALAMRQPGDELVVQALPSLRGTVFNKVLEYDVVRDLPDPTFASRSARRLIRPIELTYRRSRARRRLATRGFDVALIEMLVYQTDWLDLRWLSQHVPLASVVHDVRPHERAYPRRVEDWLLKRLYSQDCAGHLIVFSAALKAELVDEFHVDPARISVVPHWLDASDLRIPGVKKPDRPLVLFFGTLRRNKGLDVLIAAAELLRPSPSFDLVVAGEGDENQKAVLTSAANRLPFLRIEVGRVSAARKAELFSQASLLVLPYTEFHSFSGVLADAYAYRVPVIVSDVGALALAVTEDKTGWVTPVGDAAALAEAISTAVREVGASDDLTLSLQKASARHDYSQVGPLLREACLKAVAQGRAFRRSL